MSQERLFPRSTIIRSISGLAIGAGLGVLADLAIKIVVPSERGLALIPDSLIVPELALSST